MGKLRHKALRPMPGESGNKPQDSQVLKLGLPRMAFPLHPNRRKQQGPSLVPPEKHTHLGGHPQRGPLLQEGLQPSVHRHTTLIGCEDVWLGMFCPFLGLPCPSQTAGHFSRDQL